MKTSTGGFTLIELMITIAIIGIIAMIGYPAYTNAVKKGDRADGADALLEAAGHMEEEYMNNDTYVGATLNSATSKQGKYALSITSSSVFGYTLTATPVGSDAECTTLTLNQLGQKGSTGTATSADCW